MKLYVGNLSFGTTEGQLEELFGQVGQVESASIITDRNTGRSRGFGFVEMPDEAQAQKAIDELDGKEFDGRSLKVNQAKERPPRREGGGGGDRDRGQRRSW